MLFGTPREKRSVSLTKWSGRACFKNSHGTVLDNRCYTNTLLSFSVLLHYATPYCTVVHSIYYTMLYYTLPHYTVLYYTIYTILHYTIHYIYYTTLYYTILYCSTLYILYYTTLYYTILHYTIHVLQVGGTET